MKNNKLSLFWILVIAFISANALVSCVSTDGLELKVGERVVVMDDGLRWVYRTVDEDAGVVCWVFSGPSKGGIDCMSLSETELGP